MLFLLFQSISFFINSRFFWLWQDRSELSPTTVGNAEGQPNTPIFLPSGDLHTLINPECVRLRFGGKDKKLPATEVCVQHKKCCSENPSQRFPSVQQQQKLFKC